MSSSILNNAASSLPNTPLSENAAASNVMQAQTAEQVQDKDADAGKAPKRGERKSADRTQAFSALDALDRLSGNPALHSDIGKLVLGTTGNAALDAAAVAANNDTAALLQVFTPLVSDLASTPGKPGAAFTPDSVHIDAEKLSFLPMTPLTADVRVALDSAAPPTEPGHSQQPVDAKQANAQQRVRLVQIYQKLADKMFTLPGDGQVDLQKLFPNMSPAALALVQQASGQLAQAAALMRGQDPALWKGALSTLGRAGALRAETTDLIESLEDSPGLATSDIELPSPVLVKLEETAATLRKVVEMIDAEGKGGSQAEAGSASVGTAGTGGPAVAGAGKSAGSQSSNDAIQALLSNNKAAKAPSDWQPTAVSGIDFVNGDIESVAMLVMMQGVKVENSLTLDLLKNLQRMNVQKDQLRKMKTQAKQNEAKIVGQMQNEYNELKAMGLVHGTITFEQYKQWRECSFAGLSEVMGADGSVAYSLPEPQLTSPSPLNDPSVIPEWIKTGNVAKAGEKSDKDLEASFGLPKQMLAQLEKVFKALGIKDTTFEAWLTDEVGLTSAFDIDDIMANLTLAKQFLAQSADDLAGVGPTAGVQAVQNDKLQAMQNAAMELAKLELLNSAFPGTIDQNKINAKRAELNAARVSPGMNQATADAFSAWFSEALTPPSGEIKAFEQQVKAFVDYYQDTSNYEFDISKSTYMDSDDSWDVGDAARGTGSWSQGEFDDYGYSAPSTLTFTVGSGGFSASGSRDVVFDTGQAATNNYWSLKYNVEGEGPGFSEISSLLANNAGKTGTITIQDPTGLDKDAWIASYRPAVDPQLATQHAEQVAQFEANKDKLDNILSDANDVFNDMGDINDPDSPIRKWAQKNGFDEDYNAQQAALEAQKKQAGLGTQIKADNIDPATGLALDQHGSVEMMNAKMQEISDKLDSLGSLGEVESIRLQAQMEKRAKLLETLSNLLKGISQVSKTIRDNTGK